VYRCILWCVSIHNINVYRIRSCSVRCVRKHQRRRNIRRRFSYFLQFRMRLLYDFFFVLVSPTTATDRITTDRRLQMLQRCTVLYTYKYNIIRRVSYNVVYRQDPIPDTSLFPREINNNKRMSVRIYYNINIHIYI